MDHAPLAARLTELFPELSPQLQQATRYVLDHPDDVALMSMRSLAAAAGVQPSTMVRLARTLDFPGFNEFRAPFQRRVRARPEGFLARARYLQARGDNDRAHLPAEVLETNLSNLRDSFQTIGTERLERCARLLAKADRVYVMGLRSSYSLAFFFHYACSMFREDVILVESQSGRFADVLRPFKPGDVLFAISFAPYTRETVRAVEMVREVGGTVVGLTGSPVSPLARWADEALLIRNDSPSFFSSITAAMAIVEALVVLMVARGGDRTLASIEEAERQLESFGAFWKGARKRG